MISLSADAVSGEIFRHGEEADGIPFKKRSGRNDVAYRPLKQGQFPKVEDAWRMDQDQISRYHKHPILRMLSSYKL